jgi:hypothetical protein
MPEPTTAGPDHSDGVRVVSTEFVSLQFKLKPRRQLAEHTIAIVELPASDVAPERRGRHRVRHLAI